MIDQVKEFLAGPMPRKILFFDDMLTPSLIRTAYWLGLIAVAYTGVAHFFTNGFLGMFEAIIYVVTGVIVLRVVSELVMLLFKLNDNMQEVAVNSKQAANVRRRVAKKVTKKATKKATKKVIKKSSEKEAGD